LSSSIVGDKYDDKCNDNDDDDAPTDKKPPTKPKLSPTTASFLNVPPMLQWKPQVAMSMWTNDQLHDMVTVAISLSAGVDINQDCKASVSVNNKDLIVKEKMVDMLSNVDTIMHSFGVRRIRMRFPHRMPRSWDFTTTSLV
jgi:hypothetical protein